MGIDTVSLLDSDYAGSEDTSFAQNRRTGQWISDLSSVMDENHESMPDTQGDSSPYAQGKLDIDAPSELSSNRYELQPLASTKAEVIPRHRLNDGPAGHAPEQGSQSSLQQKNGPLPNMKTIQAPDHEVKVGHRLRSRARNIRCYEILFSWDPQYLASFVNPPQDVLPDVLVADIAQTMRELSQSLHYPTRLWSEEFSDVSGCGTRRKMVSSLSSTTSPVLAMMKREFLRDREAHMIGIWLQDRETLFVFCRKFDVETAQRVRGVSRGESQGPQNWWTLDHIPKRSLTDLYSMAEAMGSLLEDAFVDGGEA